MENQKPLWRQWLHTAYIVSWLITTLALAVSHPEPGSAWFTYCVSGIFAIPLAIPLVIIYIVVGTISETVQENSGKLIPNGWNKKRLNPRIIAVVAVFWLILATMSFLFMFTSYPENERFWDGVMGAACFPFVAVVIVVVLWLALRFILFVLKWAFSPR